LHRRLVPPQDSPQDAHQLPLTAVLPIQEVTPMTQKVALYARVSTSDQNAESQLRDLRAHAERRGWEVVDEYVDQGISGTRQKRPALDRLMGDARRRKFDVVAVWRFDRFARSTKHLVNALDEFRHLGISFVSYQENLDLGSPMGEAMFTIIAAIAKLERDIIADRVRSGMRRAKAQGKHVGRPRTRIHADRVWQLRQDGLSISEIALQLGASESTIRRAVKRGRATA